MNWRPGSREAIAAVEKGGSIRPGLLGMPDRVVPLQGMGGALAGTLQLPAAEVSGRVVKKTILARNA